MILITKIFKYYKIFFYNGLFFGFGFFLLSMYWVSNSILELDPEFKYISPLIFIIFPLFFSIFFWNNANSECFFLEQNKFKNILF